LGPGTIHGQIGASETPPRANYYASARSQICFSDPKFRYRPRPNENCLLRIRWASSMPANVMAAVPKDFKPSIVLMLFLLCLVQEIDEVVFPDRGERMGAMAPSGVRDGKQDEVGVRHL
jgi:hypothetical protein